MNVQEALESLGSTRIEVAKTLRKAGCKGRKSSIAHCPIAHYVQQMTGDYWVVVYYGQTRPGLGDLIANPPAVWDFIKRFDAGLIAKDLVE
jgi:hypothetical protein